jgi:hypothetical protein
MAGTKQAPTRQAITLKGSTNLVTEFFKYAVNTFVRLKVTSCSFLTQQQHSIPEGSIPFRRLPYGQEIRADGAGYTRPCIGKLSRQVSRGLGGGT